MNTIVRWEFTVASQVGIADPDAVGTSVFSPSTYGSEYPQSAESGTSMPALAPFVAGMQRLDVLPGGGGLATGLSTGLAARRRVGRRAAADTSAGVDVLGMAQRLERVSRMRRVTSPRRQLPE